MRIYVCMIVEEEENLWHRQITSSLRKMGLDVLTPPKLGLRDSWYLAQKGLWGKRLREEMTVKILDHVTKAHGEKGIDLFFCYLFPFQFLPDLFVELRDIGIPSVYFFCDNLSRQDVASEFGPYATLNWVPELEAVPMFESSGSSYIYLPMAANPDANFPMDVEENLDASFIGFKNPYRRLLLGQLKEAGVDITIFGDGWGDKAQTYFSFEYDPGELDYDSYPRLGMAERVERYLGWKKSALKRLLKHGLKPRLMMREFESLGEEHEGILRGAIHENGPLDYGAYNELFGRSSVCLGINGVFHPERGMYTYTKLRDFEATMAGACYITEKTPEVPELFEDGVEIMLYESTGELVDKAKYLLANPALRRRMRLAARARALAEHTWEHRFKMVFQRLGLDDDS